MLITSKNNALHFGELDGGSSWGSENRKIYPHEIITEQKLKAFEKKQCQKPSSVTKLFKKILNMFKK